MINCRTSCENDMYGQMHRPRENSMYGQKNVTYGKNIQYVLLCKVDKKEKYVGGNRNDKD